MIKLACNYHEETEELVKNDLIDIDYFKFPALGYQMGIFDSPNLVEFKDFVYRLKKLKPILLHGLNPSPHNICSPTFINDLEVEAISDLIKIGDLEGLSLHFDGAEDNITRTELINRTVENIKFIKGLYKNLKFFSIENIDHIRTPFVGNPDVITEVVNQSGADLLLDISHAYTISRLLKVDVLDYMKQLPLDKVYEIHINGWIENENGLMSHVKINEHAYEILEEILKYSAPKIITLEYGRHYDKINAGCIVMKHGYIDTNAMEEIREQIVRLRAIIEKYS